MDFSQLSDEELASELEARKLAQGAFLGGPFEGREQRKDAEIAAIIAELERRNAARS